MKQSFIPPRKKSAVGPELKWLLFTFVVLLVLMSGSALFLNSAISTYTATLKEVESKRERVTSEQRQVVSEIKRLQRLDKLREAVNTANRLKKENVRNFFDLVPDSVTLELVEFRGNTLHLEGVTESRQQFNSTFQRSLESLFTQSTTRFTRLKEGGYRFENISIGEDE